MFASNVLYCCAEPQTSLEIPYFTEFTLLNMCTYLCGPVQKRMNRSADKLNLTCETIRTKLQLVENDENWKRSGNMSGNLENACSMRDMWWKVVIQ